MADQKNFGIELTRVVACVMIVVTHVTSTRYLFFHPAWEWLNSVLSFSRGGAVLFMMISGALLMNRQESIGHLWKKRILRILPPLLFWAVVYLIWRLLWGLGPKSWTELLYTSAYYHLWYLYALMGIYAFLPLLRRIYQGATEAERWYYLGGWFIVASVWGLVKVWFSLPGDPVEFYQLMGFTGLMGYLFVGGWIYETRHKKLGPLGGALLILAVYLLRCLIRSMTWSLSMERGAPVAGFFFDHLSPMLLLSSLAFFALMVRFPQGNGRWRRWVLELAPLTFGIYLVHPLVFEISSRLMWIFYGTGHLPWSLLVNISVTLALSAWIVKKLKARPLFRHLL